MPEARAQIIIEGIDKFSRVAKSIERGLGGLERSALALSGVGRRLTLGVTMPMAGMGVMAVKTAAKFDTALKAIQAVGGHTEEQIEELGETFIRMSTDIKTTVDSAQTLADAFYLMTKAGYSGAESVTSLNMVIAAFLKPSKAMEEALERLGFTSGEAMLQARGLAGSLELLRGEVERGTSEWEEMFGNVRAYRGVVALTRGEMQPFRADLEAIRSATEGAGATQKTFNKMIESAELQMTSLRRQFEAATLELGRALLPAFKDTLKTLTPLIKSFADLDEGTRSFIVRAGLLSAAIGPVAIGLSKVIEASRILTTIFGKAAKGAAEKTAALGEQTVAESAAKRGAVTLTGALSSLTSVMGGLGVGAAAVAVGLGLSTVATEKLSKEIASQEEIVRRTAATYEEYLARLGFSAEGLRLLKENALGATSSQNSLLISMILTREEFERQRDALRDTRKDVWELREAWVEAKEELDLFKHALAVQAEEMLPSYRAAVSETRETFAFSFDEMSSALSSFKAYFSGMKASTVEDLGVLDETLAAFKENHGITFSELEVDLGDYLFRFDKTRVAAVEDLGILDEKITAFKVSHDSSFSSMESDLCDYLSRFLGLKEGVGETKEALSGYIAAMGGYLDALARNFGTASSAADNLKASILGIPERIVSQISHNFLSSRRGACPASRRNEASS